MRVEPTNKFLLEFLDLSDKRMLDLAVDAGIGYTTLQGWKYYGQEPRLFSFMKVADAMGYDVVLQKRGEE